ncbi:hypothetical protein HA402_007942 [Bradysia odoriphaga]|nr:hypothetical protein HA402_007942 [Bradysia odoriphaga]
MKRIFNRNEDKPAPRNERNVFDFGYHKKNVHSLPQWYALALVALALAISYASHYLLFNLPIALTIDDAKDNPNAFIAERAWADLKALNDMGPRVSGSYTNEVLAVNFLKREINSIQQGAHQNQKIHADVQVVSGAYWLGFKPQGMTSVYRNIQNVVVKLAGRSEGNGNHSLLLNCHFDSVPGSPGASDDAGSCVVMLEILRVLSKQSKVNKHSVIFLFNGAEETSLQASHGFITQHRWASDVRAFINIESAGSNGKEILFQSGPNHSWLVDMYKRSAPHPFGNSVGEEVFQSGFIPSDTDFRVFRDFGNIPGLDLAHPMNGYRYHTKYDHIDYISSPCLQRTGDNVLGLVRNIANSEQLFDVKSHAKGINIYYDFLGLVFISYSQNVAIVLNVLVGFFSVILPYLSLKRTTNAIHTNHIRRQMFIGFFNNIIAVILSAGLCYGIAIELDSSDHTMSWYTHKIFATFLYVIPVLFTFCLVHRFIFKTDNLPISLSLQIQSRLIGTAIMWSLLLLALTAFNLRSGYMICVPLAITLLSNITISITSVQNSIRKWLYVHVFYQLFVLLWTLNSYHLLTGIFIPMIGRSGGERNPEITVAAICTAVTIYSISFIVPLIGLLNRTKWIFVSMIAMFLMARISLSTTNIGFPYTDDSGKYPTPQRHYISHTVRTVYGENGQEIYSDSGFWVRQIDRNTRKTVESLFAPEIPVSQEVNVACSKTVFCGLPFHSMRHLYSTGYWVPGPAPIIQDEASLKLNSKQIVNGNERELHFTMSGNVLTSIGLQPKPGVELVHWDIISDTIPPENSFLGNKVYLIAFNRGLDIDPMNFTLKFKIDEKVHTGSSVVDVMLVSYFWEYHQQHTPFFAQLLNKLPSWAFAVPSVSSFKAWTF